VHSPISKNITIIINHTKSVKSHFAPTGFWTGWYLSILRLLVGSGPWSWWACWVQWRAWLTCQTSDSSPFQRRGPAVSTGSTKFNSIHPIWIQWISMEGKTDLWPRDCLHWFLVSHFLHGIVVFLLIIRHEHFQWAACLFLLLIKVVNDDPNEEVERKEGAKDDEDDKVDVHDEIVLPVRLQLLLHYQQ